MEEIRKADKVEAEENRRKDKAAAKERDIIVVQKTEEQSDAAETKATAIQESTLTIMSQMLTLQAESADQQERMEATEELIRQKQAVEQMKVAI